MDKTSEKHFGLRAAGDILAKFRYVCGFEERSANAQIIQLMLKFIAEYEKNMEESRWSNQHTIQYLCLYSDELSSHHFKREPSGQLQIPTGCLGCSCHRHNRDHSLSAREMLGGIISAITLVGVSLLTRKKD